MTTPDGFVLVPREPTDAMRKAFIEANDAHNMEYDEDRVWRSVRSYKAMLAAAPVAGEEGHVHNWDVKWVDGNTVGQQCYCGTERDIKVPRLSEQSSGHPLRPERRSWNDRRDSNAPLYHGPLKRCGEERRQSHRPAPQEPDSASVRSAVDTSLSDPSATAPTTLSDAGHLQDEPDEDEYMKLAHEISPYVGFEPTRQKAISVMKALWARASERSRTDSRPDTKEQFKKWWESDGHCTRMECGGGGRYEESFAFAAWNAALRAAAAKEGA